MDPSETASSRGPDTIQASRTIVNHVLNTGEGVLKMIDIHASPSFSTEWLD